MTIDIVYSATTFIPLGSIVLRPTGFGITDIVNANTPILAPTRAIHVVVNTHKPEVSVPGSLRSKKNKLKEKQEQREAARRSIPANPLFAKLGIGK